MWLAVQSQIVDICDITKGLVSVPARLKVQFVKSEAEVEESPLSLLLYATPARLLLA